jgi:hypothetical protein
MVTLIQWPSLHNNVSEFMTKGFMRSIPGPNVIKLFLSGIYEFGNKLGRPFQPSLVFVGKARSLPKSEAPERCFTGLQPNSQTLDKAGKASQGQTL